jgi:hypothetical protein
MPGLRAVRPDAVDLVVLDGSVGTVVNLGAVNPRYAHTDEARVELDALVRGHEVLTAFLTEGITTRGRA